MSTLYFVVSITEREKLSQVLEIMERHCFNASYVALGYGTAQNEVLSHLGLGDSERAVCMSVASGHVFRAAKRDFKSQMNIEGAGNGVIFTVPLSSIGGYREFSFFTYGEEFVREEESTMKETDYALLIAICNQGYSETVMEAARRAGAGGGTVLRAQGTGRKEAEKFLGISLISEKDMTLIVTTTKKKNAIMESIMKEAGLDTPAKAVVFTLPVKDLAGVRLIDDDEEDEEETEKNG